MNQPRVLIEVSGGVCEARTTGGVAVGLIDWDNIEAGDEPPEDWEKFAGLRPDLRNDMKQALAGRQLELKFE